MCSVACAVWGVEKFGENWRKKSGKCVDKAFKVM